MGAFLPDQITPRWQMALFLVQAAAPAGIVTATATDQGFTDLDQLGSHTREAINQLGRASKHGGHRGGRRSHHSPR